MKLTRNTTVRDVFENVLGAKLRSQASKSVLGEMTLHEWATYFAEDAPRRVPRDHLPRDHQVALELVDIMERRLRSKGKALLERHGPADPPEFVENLPDNEEDRMANSGPIPDDVIREAARTLWVGAIDETERTERDPAHRGPRSVEREMGGREPVTDETIRQARRDLFT